MTEVNQPDKKLKTQHGTPLLRVYRAPACTPHATQTLLQYLSKHLESQPGSNVDDLQTEYCFYIETHEDQALTDETTNKLQWLLGETFEPEGTQPDQSFLQREYKTYAGGNSQWLVEVGARLNFSTAWSSNAVAICHACGIKAIKRIERATRYLVRYTTPVEEAEKTLEVLKTALLARECDRMTQQVYETPLESFWHGKTVEPVHEVPILEQGKKALEEINARIGLGFDDWDLDYYLTLFQNKMKRNPTDVECFDMGQSNSEHCRHWFFGGNMEIDGELKEKTLFELVKSTLTEEAKENSVIAFHDNSSAIKGATITTLKPVAPGEPSACAEQTFESHALLTAETHNFPSGVAPFPGAETGTGGRIRDVQATGRGAHVIAGISAYSVGNLLLDDYPLAWEDASLPYPSNLATPKNILIQASNGASDYGNKFGEPVIAGFTRSFGLVLPSQQGERREYLKPIMFSGGIGQLNATHCDKGDPEVSMWVVKLGGPAYRIGMGGGAASSRIQDVKDAALDFNAVQRGDAEMESKMNKVIRACIDLGDANPIVTIHDQGAGGNGNVLKEIVEVPASKQTETNRGGARYEVRNILLGDDTLSVMEIWGAEYQENNALLLRAEDTERFRRICERENCPFALLGQVTGDGRVVLHDKNDDSTPVDLDLELVLGKMPRKTFVDKTHTQPNPPLSFPTDLTIRDALDRVLRLVSVGSKRFLTTKVDRCVSGMVAQQQTVGPLQITLADVAVIAQSQQAHNGCTTGIASAVGEQPIKGLVDPAAMARLSVGESLTNLVWASLARRGIRDCKCSANWMWAAKLPTETARMYACCAAMTEFMKQIGVAVDGGKDSLSMAAKVNSDDVKAPGTLVITMYAACDDVEKTVTPDFKPQNEGSVLYYVDLGKGSYRLGGSALAHVYKQVGNASPDVDDSTLFSEAFGAMQECIKQRLILAGHDRSDGGLLLTLLEMAFAGNCGFSVDIPYAAKPQATTMDVLQVLFAEELGFVFQVAGGDAAKQVEGIFAAKNVPLARIGTVSTSTTRFQVRVNGQVVIEDDAVELRDVWEATSFELDKLQCNPECVASEQASLRARTGPTMRITYDAVATPERQLSTRNLHRVAVIREEGSNSEREMLSAFHAAGLEAWDVTMSDLVAKRITLDERFRGVAFVGGFAFADVMGSAKGWAGVVKFHEQVLQQFSAFRARENTFSFGACNGCQLMTLLGWLNPPNAEALEQELQVSAMPRFIHNESGRHECRFVTVQIQESNSVLLKDMAGTSIGVWVSHGEGRAHFTHPKIMQNMLDNNLAPVRYIDDGNNVTEEYPFNPNGSPCGIAGLVSADGRHLCMMPHPERSHIKWQWPYMPPNFQSLPVSPWLKLFQNAKRFCEEVN